MSNKYFDVEKKLKESKILEGGLFAYISINYILGTYYAEKYFHTVKDGVVYEIQDSGDLQSTGDMLLDLQKDCHRIGQYDPSKKYKSTRKELSYSEIKKALKL